MARVGLLQQLSTITMIDAEESEWSLSSVHMEPIPPRVIDEDNEASFSHVSLQQEYSYETTHPPKQRPLISGVTTLHPVGKVVAIVEDFLVVQSEGQKVMDLENYLLNKDREIIGYTVDVFGQVGKPYYAVKHQEVVVEIGERVFYCEGCRILDSKELEKLNQVAAVEVEVDSEDEEIPSGAFKRDYQRMRDKSVEYGPRKVNVQQWRHQQGNQRFGRNQQQQQMYQMGQGGQMNQMGQMNQQMSQVNPMSQMTPSSQQVFPQMPQARQMSPQQLLLMSQYYQNCYNHMMMFPPTQNK